MTYFSYFLDQLVQTVLMVVMNRVTPSLDVTHLDRTNAVGQHNPTRLELSARVVLGSWLTCVSSSLQDRPILLPVLTHGSLR